MEDWLLLGILAYLSYSISTSIDKHMMDMEFSELGTNTWKMFLDGVVLLVIGSAFLGLELNAVILLPALLLGVLKAASGLFYFHALSLKDVEEVVPYLQSFTILLVFISSIILFDEYVTGYNILGVLLVLAGVYSVLSRTGLAFPNMDRGLAVATGTVILMAGHTLLAKELLSGIRPIDLSIAMYFFTAAVLFSYQAAKGNVEAISWKDRRLRTILPASVFGGLGTFLLFWALSVGNASKVYPIAGLQSVFVFLIALAFLRQNFRMHRMIGTLLVFAGIYLISI